MRSDDLRAIGPRTWATLSDEARALLDAYDLKPAPFELDAPAEPTATILQWNDPARAKELERLRNERNRKPPMTRIVRAAPASALTPPRPFTPPRNDQLAKELAGLSSMSAAKIAAFTNVPLAEVEAMRGGQGK